MNLWYVIGGIICLSFGTFITIIQVKKISGGKQDNLGFSIQLLAGGIMAIILGVAMIVQNI